MFAIIENGRKSAQFIQELTESQCNVCLVFLVT